MVKAHHGFIFSFPKNDEYSISVFRYRTFPVFDIFWGGVVNEGGRLPEINTQFIDGVTRLSCTEFFMSQNTE